MQEGEQSFKAQLPFQKAGQNVKAEIGDIKCDVSGLIKLKRLKWKNRAAVRA